VCMPLMYSFDTIELESNYRYGQLPTGRTVLCQLAEV
jgi:hypothetical protein